MSKTVNRSQLAELLGVSLNTVDNWVRDGCPFVRRPIRQGVGQWEFLASSVFDWRINRERQAVLGDVVTLDENEARRRKLAAEAGLAELELHQASGLVVKVADSERVWVQMVGAARARLLSLPNKLGPITAIETDPLVCQSIFEAGIVEALSELSGFETFQSTDADEDSLNDDAVDARLAAAAQSITKIRNSAASGGAKRLATIITECDRARAEIFGVPNEPGRPQKPAGSRQKGGIDLGATAQVNDQRMGRQRKKAQPGVE